MASPSLRRGRANQATTNKKENNTMDIKQLVGKKLTQEVKFMGEKVTIKKLTLAEVQEMQDLAKKAAGSENTEDDGASFNVLRLIVRASVEGASDLTDDDFGQFPIDELSRLSNDIMKFSGIGEAGK